MVDGVSFSQSCTFYCFHQSTYYFNVCKLDLGGTLCDFYLGTFRVLEVFFVIFSFPFGNGSKSLYRNRSFLIQQIETFIEVNLDSRNEETNLKLLTGLLFLLIL